MNRPKKVENDSGRPCEPMDEMDSHMPRQPRAGWAEASKEIAALGGDTLVLPEFANEFDSEWIW